MRIGWRMSHCCQARCPISIGIGLARPSPASAAINRRTTMKLGRLLILALAAGGLALIVQPSAHAQLNNEPFSFDRPGTSGLGMSDAARQAILNQEIYGSTPDHIMIGPGGVLLEIERPSDGHVAIATLPDGSFLQGYRGRGLDLGGFAPFFQTDDSSGGYAGLVVQGNARSIINSWTFGVLVGFYDAESLPGRVGYMHPGSSSIDAWTMQVANLSAI